MPDRGQADNGLDVLEGDLLASPGGTPGTSREIVRIGPRASVVVRRMDFRPVPEDVGPECRQLAESLRVLGQRTGRSLRGYAVYVYRDPGRLSKYFSGQEVPAADFVEKLIADGDEATGVELRADVHEHVRRLHRAALLAVSPRNASVQALRDEITSTNRELSKAHTLIEVLTESLERARQRVRDLESENHRLSLEAAASSAFSVTELAHRREEREQLHADRDRLRQQVTELEEALEQAQQHTRLLEQRCSELEDQLEAAGDAAADEDVDADTTILRDEEAALRQKRDEEAALRQKVEEGEERLRQVMRELDHATDTRFRAIDEAAVAVNRVRESEMKLAEMESRLEQAMHEAKKLPPDVFSRFFGRRRR